MTSASAARPRQAEARLGDQAALHAIIEKSPIPNLWKPGRDSYVKVDALPVMGSGKLDVRPSAPHPADGVARHR